MGITKGPFPPHQLRWLEIVVGAILVLNLVDAIATMAWIELGWAVEANPLMAAAMDLGLVPFALAKLGLVTAGCYLLWRARQHVWAVVAAFLLFLTYYAIVVQHAGAIGYLAMAWAERLAA